MSEKFRINVRSVANVAKIRKEKRNGRDIIVVPSATLPDNIVMNGILYPADEIAKSFKGLERKPAPLGHPMVNGKMVSASDPEGLALGWIGAWNENVRQEGGRVLLDKVIDVAIANQSEGGKKVIAAIDGGAPIHTSTGLYCLIETANEGDGGYKQIARGMVWDHDAILLDVSGAATPEQGVGMLVNSKGEAEDITVINSALSDADMEIDWAGSRLVEALMRKQNVSVWERVKAAIIEAVGVGREPSTNEKETEMPTVDEQIKALSEKVDSLADTVTKPSEAMNKAIADAITLAVKPLVDANAALVANAKAKEDADKAVLVTKVVKGNMLSEAVANTLSLEALTELAGKVKEPGKAAPLNGATMNGATSTRDAFKVPAGEKAVN